VSLFKEVTWELVGRGAERFSESVTAQDLSFLICEMK
jgi:hypothetical protein